MNSGPLYRVYKPEWLVYFISDEVGTAGAKEAADHFEKRYEGRVRTGDRKINCMGIRKPARSHLQLRLPNLKGECADPDEAEVLRSWLGGKAVVVVRGSAQERELLGYGRRRLPK